MCNLKKELKNFQKKGYKKNVDEHKEQEIN